MLLRICQFPLSFLGIFLSTYYMMLVACGRLEKLLLARKLERAVDPTPELGRNRVPKIFL